MHLPKVVKRKPKAAKSKFYLFKDLNKRGMDRFSPALFLYESVYCIHVFISKTEEEQRYVVIGGAWQSG